MYTDTIADYLTRIRNASMAGHKVVDIPSSNIKKDITKILFDQGYILSYKFEETKNNQGSIKIALKYDSISKEPVIKEIQRISKPGLRKYSSSSDLPRVLNGPFSLFAATSFEDKLIFMPSVNGVTDIVVCRLSLSNFTQVRMKGSEAGRF